MRVVLVWQDQQAGWERALASPLYVSHTFHAAPELFAYLENAPDALRPFVLVVAASLPAAPREKFFARFQASLPERYAETTILLAQERAGERRIELYKERELAPDATSGTYIH